MKRAVNIMLSNPLTLTLDDDIDTAIRLMKEENLTAVPVVDRERKVQGILTEQGLVQAFVMLRANEVKSSKLSAHTMVFEKPIVADASDSAMALIRKLAAPNSGQMIVQDEKGALLGMISPLGILTALL